MWSPFQRGTSPVDWCEENYTFSPLIAEFVNTFSNFIFFLIPPLLMHLFREYGKVVNQGIHVVWLLLIVVGMGSAYFHATLSLFGQLLDELAILWVFFAAFSIFIPRRLFPTCIHNDRRKFSMVAVCISVICTGLAIINPVINAVPLMTLAIPSAFLLIHEIRRANNLRVYHLGIRSGVICILAVFCWVNDRLFCEAWTYINFPYLHGLWHIFIFIACYSACVLGAYISVEGETPYAKAVLMYWPRNDFELGIPYVAIKTQHIDVDHNI